MEYIIGLYIIGAILISIFLVVSTWKQPLEGFGLWETFFMLILTTVIWPVFVGHALYKYNQEKNL